MKRHLSLFIVLCIVHTGFAQVKINSVSNTGMGAAPDLKAKLLLYNKTAATDTVFGLRSTVWNTLNSGPSTPNKPTYGIHSINTNQSYSPLYGAYFKNTQSNPSIAAPGPLYGIYMDNNNSTYDSSIHGVYVNNTSSNYLGTTCGFYANNSVSNYGGMVYGLYSNNTGSNYTALYGVYSINSAGANGSVYGAYFSVSGASAGNRYAGYFTGGKVVVMNGDVGIGTTSPAYTLDVNGYIRSPFSVILSDERLKSGIKPLSTEKEKLYLLEGKSYLKKLLPTGLEEDSLAEKKEEIVEFPEYGYLAQELKEIFPDLVSRDSAGYYSVNYIGLIPVIIEALKDQRVNAEGKQVQIEKLQSQVDEQREQIKQLVKLMNIKSINEKVFEENGIESIPILLQNTPNPFNQATEIGYYIPENVNSANIYIYDINGFQQRNISISGRGKGATTLQAAALQAGIYFYTLICDGKPVDTKQMILTR